MNLKGGTGPLVYVYNSRLLNTSLNRRFLTIPPAIPQDLYICIRLCIPTTLPYRGIAFNTCCCLTMGRYKLTNQGTNIFIAQSIFVVLYLAFIAVVFAIYSKTKVFSFSGFVSSFLSTQKDLKYFIVAIRLSHYCKFNFFLDSFLRAVISMPFKAHSFNICSAII